MLSVSGDMADHSNLYLEGGNASKSTSYSQDQVQYLAQNRCLVSIYCMNDGMENPFGALLWRDKNNMVLISTGFHQAFTSGIGFEEKCSVVEYLSPQLCNVLHRFDCAYIFSFSSWDGQYSQQ